MTNNNVNTAKQIIWRKIHLEEDIEVLSLYNLELTAIPEDIKSCIHLKELLLSLNNINTIPYLRCFNKLKVLEANECCLTRLNVKPLKRLESLSCADSNSTVPMKMLDARGLKHLTYLDCSENNIVALRVKGCVSLNEFYSTSFIKDIDVPSCYNPTSRHTALLVAPNRVVCCCFSGTIEQFIEKALSDEDKDERHPYIIWARNLLKDKVKE